MNLIKVVAITLIALGTLALVYGGFRYTKETHNMKLGPMEMSIKDRGRVHVPIWAGVGAIVVGGVLLVFPINRKNN